MAWLPSEVALLLGALVAWLPSEVALLLGEAVALLSWPVAALSSALSSALPSLFDVGAGSGSGICASGSSSPPHAARPNPIIATTIRLFIFVS